MERNALDISRVEALVLDEADRLLDLGFSAELERVLAALPARRQNLLFSATFAQGVQALAGGLLRDAVRIEAAAAPTASRSSSSVIEVDAGRRTELLRHLVKQGGWRGVGCSWPRATRLNTSRASCATRASRPPCTAR